MAVIDTLGRLIDLLVKEDVSAADVADALGGERREGGANRAMSVTPGSGPISRADVFPGAPQDTPNHVTLTINDGLTLDDLRSALGDGHAVPRMKPGDMQRQSFRAAREGGAYTIALIASHQGDDVKKVVLRRDRA
jgi:hypothetical protein